MRNKAKFIENSHTIQTKNCTIQRKKRNILLEKSNTIIRNKLYN